MNIKFILIILVLFSLFYCSRTEENLSYVSETLKITQLSNNSFQFVSYLDTESFGKVACNGMIVRKKGEALVFDTPTSDSVSKELIYWVKHTLKCELKGVVVNHFHDDCLGGLSEFHNHNVPSYSTFKTIRLAKIDSVTFPLNGFEDKLVLRIGDIEIGNYYLGEGHSKDNIVSYFPEDKVLFGGCMIKSIDANKGYLGAANVEQWPKTVEKVKVKFNNSKIVIPGHGKPGGIELLDYTINLFKN